MNGKEISPGETITCTVAKPSENNRNQNRRPRGKIIRPLINEETDYF